METWMIYALIATLFIGIVSFLHKVQSEHKTIENNSFIFYTYFYQLIICVLIFIFSGKELIFSKENILYAFVIIFLYTYILKTRITSLKYIDASTYFINYRIFSSILLIIFGQILFGEIISISEYLGICIGFFIFYLLFEKKHKTEKNTKFIKGMLYVGYGIGLITIIQLLAKDFVISGFDVYSLLFFENIFGIVIIFVLQGYKNYKKLLYIPKKKDNILLCINGCCMFLSALYNNLAFEHGDIAIVYKIISYSLFIPIILSIIFYKEKVTVKKSLAFLLTIVSVGLFI